MKVLHISDKTFGGAETAFDHVYNASSKYFESKKYFPETNKLSRILSILFPYNPITRTDIDKEIFAQKPDIVHLHKINLASLAAIVSAKESNCKVVMSIYDYWLFCPRDNLYNGKPCSGPSAKCVKCYNPRGKKINALLKFPLLFRPAIVKHFIKHVDMFHVLSNASKALMIRMGIPADKIAVVYMPCVDQDKKDWAITNKYDVSKYGFKFGKVLFVGAITQNKGPLELAVSIDFDKECTIHIIGKSFNDGYSKNIIENPALHRVVFHGEVSKNVVYDHIKTSQIIAIPEQWENMGPLILMEAMACGKCIVASDIGGIREILGNAGVYGMDKINGLIDNPELCNKLGVKAYKKSVRYTKLRTARGIKCLYESTLGTKGQGPLSLQQDKAQEQGH